MKRNALNWFLSLAASGLLLATPLFAQKGDEPGRVNANKQVEPVNNQGQRRDINDQIRAEGQQPAGQPGRGGVVINRRAPGSGGRAAYNETMQQQLDSDIAECLILANQNEVALAKLAASKTQNDDVKKFADMLERDHSQMVAKLQKFTNHNFSDRDTTKDANWTTGAAAAPAAGATRENVREEIRNENRETRQEIREDRREGRERKAEDRAEARGAAPAAQPAAGGVRVQENAGGNNHANELISIHHQIKHEMADQCLADSRKELSSKESNRFDECFVGMQIAGHMKMDTELKVLRRHASSGLGEVLSSGQQTTEQHLKEAKSLIEKLTKNTK